MCSVSFLPHSRGFYLGMNRDESLQRAAANPPALFTRDCLALYPTEPAGGSWVGVNEAGLTAALINWYAVMRRPGSGRVSRGIIVPTVLRAAELDAALRALATVTLADVAPFRLLLFASGERRACELRWDQRTLDEIPHTWTPQHWFSSGYDEPRAQDERLRVAREKWSKPEAGRLPWLRRLHGSHEPARGPFCFCMHRKDAATVSYTEIVVTRRAATMRYHDGPPCRTPQPKTTHQLSLQLARKESTPSPTNEHTRHAHENHRCPLQPSRRPLLPSRVSSRGEVRTVAR